ncbi:MAG: carboxylate--amine ligase, partial [Lachnospiraceae bacterium]|nr:carboxylate--amine ligase [Lachnospiraceae bacterium]
MKKLMILGAGIYQLPLIETARQMGLYTIVVSIPGNYPGFAAADKVYYENTVDSEKILEIARAEQIDGILTAGTDVAVVTIGKVCDELGLT